MVVMVATVLPSLMMLRVSYWPRFNEMFGLLQPPPLVEDDAFAKPLAPLQPPVVVENAVATTLALHHEFDVLLPPIAIVTANDIANGNQPSRFDILKLLQKMPSQPPRFHYEFFSFKPCSLQCILKDMLPHGGNG